MRAEESLGERGRLIMNAQIEQWPLNAPFRISGYTFESLEVVVVTLSRGEHTGRGEAAGVYYKRDAPATMLEQLRSVRGVIEAGVTCAQLQTVLPPGGARNAVDCALWDLEAKATARHAWEIAGLEQPRPVLTTFTCGADTPDKMVAAAREYVLARAIKLKLTGEPVDAERVRAVRAARPDVWLGVDANQGFTLPFLERLMPVLVEANVRLVEQPLPIGQEAQLDGFASPIPIAADESVQSSADIASLAGRFDVVNIKLDKCGGLTEALAMARASRALGLETMVGNMMGTSLAMAPAFLVGQLCSVVDLDGPVFLKRDRAATVRYDNGLLTCPEAVWG